MRHIASWLLTGLSRLGEFHFPATALLGSDVTGAVDLSDGAAVDAAFRAIVEWERLQT